MQPTAIATTVTSSTGRRVSADSPSACLTIHLIHFTKEQADLDHGYVDLLDTNPWAKQAFESLLLFVSKHISDKETNR